MKLTTVPNTTSCVDVHLEFMHGDTDAYFTEVAPFLDNTHSISEENKSAIVELHNILTTLVEQDPRHTSGTLRKRMSSDDAVGYFLAGLVEEWPCDITTRCGFGASLQSFTFYFFNREGVRFEIEI